MSLDALIDRYCEAWSHESPEERRQALRECWGDNAVYSDPTVLVEGADALAAHITGLRARVPNMKIARTSQVDLHHDSARFNWGLTSNGAPAVDGVDFVTIKDGRIASVTGFMGPLKPVAT
jgi:hypothetical protein